MSTTSVDSTPQESEQTTGPRHSPERRDGPPRFWLIAGAVVALAFALNWFVANQFSPTPYEPRPLLDDVAAEVDLEQSQPLTFADAQPPGPAAPSAIEAVEAFAQAEIVGDYDTSFGLLSENDRETYRSTARWQLAHNDLPRLTDLTNLEAGANNTVTATAFLEPQLTRRLGAVAATGTMAFTTVAEDGGFRVNFTDSTMVATYPERNGAVTTAAEWAAATQRCEDTTATELEGGLLGVIGFVPALCGAEGEITTATTAAPMSSLENPAPILNGLGPTAGDYVAVVAVDGPVPMRISLAPEGERWIVVGLDQP